MQDLMRCIFPLMYSSISVVKYLVNNIYLDLFILIVNLLVLR